MQFCSVDTLQGHTDAHPHVQKGSADQEDALWKALLGLASARQGIPQGKDWVPLRLAHLGGTTEWKSRAGWDGGTGERP